MKFILTPRRKSFNKKDAEALERDLMQLGEFIQEAGLDVYLVGGTAVNLSNGEPLRNHHDFDIAIFTEGMKGFYDYLTSRGYELVARRTPFHFSGNITSKYRLSVVSETEPRRILEENQNRLRILRKRPGIVVKTENRMDYFDLFLLEMRNNGVYLIEHDTIVPKKEFLPIKEYPLKNNTRLLIPNMDYRNYLIGTKKLPFAYTETLHSYNL